MINLTRILTISTVFVALTIPAIAANFDIVIKNGRVMDPETNFDSIANVGINNGFITKITTESIEGERTIDAAIQ